MSSVIRLCCSKRIKEGEDDKKPDEAFNTYYISILLKQLVGLDLVN